MTKSAFEGVPIEQVRDYWNRRPCNIRHSTKPLGSREYFDEVETRKYLVEPHIPEFAEFSRWAGKKVLEVGCGIGTDTVMFARHGAQVTCMDLSEKSLEIAHQRVQLYGLADNVRFYHGSAEMLSTIVPVEPYDLIYSFGVIHHTPHPDMVLHELRKYSARGTTVKIMVYHRHSWKVLWILLTSGKGRFWRLEDIVAQHSEAETGCPVTYTYTRREAAQWLERCGFRTRKLSVEHIFPYRIPDYVQYRYVREWYFRWMPAAMFHSLEKHFGWHLCLTAEPKA
jgi:ubiquinone/menaquinone biosynthesis C-methylase UbiE